MRNSQVFGRNGNNISTPNKHRKQNNSNYNDDLQEENTRLKKEIYLKNNELREVKKTYENLQKKLNELKRKSGTNRNNNYLNRNNNNYSNRNSNNNFSARNNNVHYNNYIRNTNRINSDELNDSFGDFSDPFFNNFFSEVANPFMGRIRSLNNRNFNPGDYMDDYNIDNIINQFH